ncbi:MAG: response regulator [Proteobacteria bacterium]|nr:response regulator [Pseudomonadota bacterium]MBU1058387.1 response regulator [Pseudomonadota bacterium]
MNKTSPVILSIEDESLVRQSFRFYLENCGYQVQEAEDGRIGLDLVHRKLPDLVLLDLRLPEVDGLDVLQELHEKYPDLPIIVISGTEFIGDAVEAMKRGAWSYLLKPITDFNVLRYAVAQTLEKVRFVEEQRNYCQKLEEMVQLRARALERSNQLLRDTRMEVVLRLGKASEFRDKATGRHAIRVSSYTKILANCMGFSEEDADIIALGSALHDVGKIGISDGILLKPGKLSSEEWSEMQKHCLFGRDLLTPINLKDGGGFSSDVSGALEEIVSDSDLLQLSRVVAYSHHERWDGSGYPEGLKGDEIPVVARIVTAVDIYDAIGSKRPYKEAFSEEECLQIMREASGTILDPEVVETFFSSLGLFQEVKEKWAD